MYFIIGESDDGFGGIGDASTQDLDDSDADSDFQPIASDNQSSSESDVGMCIIVCKLLKSLSMLQQLLPISM